MDKASQLRELDSPSVNWRGVRRAAAQAAGHAALRLEAPATDGARRPDPGRTRERGPAAQPSPRLSVCVVPLRSEQSAEKALPTAVASSGRIDGPGEPTREGGRGRGGAGWITRLLRYLRSQLKCPWRTPARSRVKGPGRAGGRLCTPARPGPCGLPDPSGRTSQLIKTNDL